MNSKNSLPQSNVTKHFVMELIFYLWVPESWAWNDYDVHLKIFLYFQDRINYIDKVLSSVKVLN